MAREHGFLRDCSGSISSGGSAQNVAGASERSYLLIQNKSAATESFWVSFVTTAVADSPSIEVVPGTTLTWDAGFIPSGIISVIAATTGTKFTIKEG